MNLQHLNTSKIYLFPKLSEAKIKAGIFVGPQIKKIMECKEFSKKLTRTQLKAWNIFIAVFKGFLGNHRDENYVELVQSLVNNFGKMGCRMSLKVHFLNAHLDKFQENMGTYSEEQGERFHQDIIDFERRYQGSYNENMMGDHIWGLIRESDFQCKRQSRKHSYLIFLSRSRFPRKKYYLMTTIILQGLSLCFNLK